MWIRCFTVYGNEKTELNKFQFVECTIGVLLVVLTPLYAPFICYEVICPQRPTGYEDGERARWVTSEKQLTTVFRDGSPPNKESAEPRLAQAIGDDYVNGLGYVRTLLSSPSNQIPSPQPEKSTHLSTKTMCAFFNEICPCGQVK